LAFVRLKPTNDLVFKLLFIANPALLRDLLEAVLQPSSPIASLEVLDTEIPGDLAGSKAIRLDVRARSEDASIFNVEMQAYGHLALPARFLFYWARGYTEPLGRGQPYSLLRPTISIVWSTVTMVPTPFGPDFLAQPPTKNLIHWQRKIPPWPTQ